MPLIRATVATAEELQALVGARAKRLRAGGCEILFGDAATAIIAPAGDSVTSSSVWNGTEFRLRNEGLALPAEPFGPTLPVKARTLERADLPPCKAGFARSFARRKRRVAPRRC